MVKCTQEMAQGVKDSVASINRLTEAQLISQINTLEREKLTVELQKCNPAYMSNPRAMASLDKRLQQIDTQIAQVESMLDANRQSS